MCYICILAPYDWSDKKGEWLRQERRITFEEVLYHLAHGDLLDIVEHSTQTRYSGQRVFIVNVEGQTHLVPFVEDDRTILLKTVISSKKMKKKEKDVLDSVERGEWKRIPNFTQEAARYRETARATLRKDKRVNIRMTERDLLRFRKAALHDGLPYQTLISSILHKYINGRLTEKTK